MRQVTHVAAARLGDSLSELATGAQAFLDSVRRHGAMQSDEATTRLERRIREARASLADSGSQFAGRLSRTGRSAAATIKKHPWASVGIAAGATAAIGVLAALLRLRD